MLINTVNVRVPTLHNSGDEEEGERHLRRPVTLLYILGLEAISPLSWLY